MPELRITGIGNDRPAVPIESMCCCHSLFDEARAAKLFVEVVFRVLSVLAAIENEMPA